MGKVIKFRNKINETEYCSGCHKLINREEGFHEITLSYKDYDKHIVLCPNCFELALNHEVSFEYRKK